jgi:8-oxo-dGTP pyrophosphatase MutT (NUDIX family)
MSIVYRALYKLAKVYWRFRRPLTMGVRAIVLDHEQRVLLVRHSYLPGWHLPGGGVERGESSAQAAQREIHEEGGILAEPSDLLLEGLYVNFHEFKSDHVALYSVRSWRQGSATAHRREIVEAAFFPLTELPNGTTSSTRKRLQELGEKGLRTGAW